MRTEPNFNKKNTSEEQTRKNGDWGCIWSPLVIVIGYIVVSAIARVNSNTGSRFDQIVCYGTLICIVAMFILVDLGQKKEWKRVREARREWKLTCKSAKVAIVSRYGHPGGTNDDGYELHYFRPSYHLDITPGADQMAASPNQTIMQVKVTSNIFEKLEKRDTVRIYYKPESPLEFLLEEEIE